MPLISSISTIRFPFESKGKLVIDTDPVTDCEAGKFATDIVPLIVYEVGKLEIATFYKAGKF